MISRYTHPNYKKILKRSKKQFRFIIKEEEEESVSVNNK